MLHFFPLQILTQSRTEKRTPTYFHRLALDSVITSKGSLILLNGPNAIEIQKVHSNAIRKIQVGFQCPMAIQLELHCILNWHSVIP